MAFTGYKKVSNIQKGQIYGYQENFTGTTNEALVKVVNIHPGVTYDEHLLRVVEIKKGHFTRGSFRIRVYKNQNGPIHHNFFEVITYG